MLKKLILLTPIISSLVFSTPASGAVSVADNIKMLDEINGLVAQIASALAEIESASVREKSRDPLHDNPEIDGQDGLKAKIARRLSLLKNYLSNARSLSAKAEEAQPLSGALRNAASILGESKIFMRDTTLNKSYRDPVQKIIDILETGGLLDKLRAKLNLLGSVSYRVSISGQKQEDVVLDIGGQPVLFKPGETTKIVTLPSRLPSAAVVRISTIKNPSVITTRSVIVSTPPPNCIVETKMNFPNLSISSGSAIISGGRGKIEMDEKKYTPEILFANALANSQSSFENNPAIGAVAKETLRKLPSAAMFTHTGSGNTANLHVVGNDGRVKNFVIYYDSARNLSSYYEARDLKNLDKLLLMGEFAEDASVRDFLSKFSNLSEAGGYPVLIAPHKSGAGLLAKTNRLGSYVKIIDLAGDKISMAYASKNSKLEIIMSSKDLTRSAVEKIIGGITPEKSEYRIGIKAFTQGLWRMTTGSNQGVGADIRFISLALAQDDPRGGDGGFFMDTPGVFNEPPPSFEPAPAPPADGGLLTGPSIPATPSSVTPPAGVSTGGKSSKPPRESGIDYAAGLAIEITSKGVKLQVVDPESKDWDPYGEYSGGGPTCGKDREFKTPGFDPRAEDLVDGKGLELPPPEHEYWLSILRGFLKTPGGSNKTPPTTDDLRNSPTQIETPGGFNQSYKSPATTGGILGSVGSLLRF